MNRLLFAFALVFFCLVSCNSKNLGRNHAKKLLELYHTSHTHENILTRISFKEDGFAEAIEAGYIVVNGYNYRISPMAGSMYDLSDEINVYNASPGSGPVIFIECKLLHLDAVKITSINGITSTEKGTPDEKRVDYTMKYSFKDQFIDKGFADCLDLSQVGVSSSAIFKRYDDGWRIEKLR